MLNSVSLCGLISFPIELKSTDNGVIYCDNMIGVQSNRKNKDNVYPWNNIHFRAWGPTAEFLHRNFKQGDAISIIGELFSFKQSFGDVTKELTWVRADTITFVPKSRGDVSSVPAPIQQAPKQTVPPSRSFGIDVICDEDSDLPF